MITMDRFWMISLEEERFSMRCERKVSNSLSCFVDLIRILDVWIKHITNSFTDEIEDDSLRRTTSCCCIERIEEDSMNGSRL